MLFTSYAQQVQTLVRQGIYQVANRTVDEQTWADQLTEVLNPTHLGCIWVIGNGGSATVASHFVVDCVNRLNLRAQTLHESAVLTCLSNDYGYEEAFAQQVKKLARADDLLVVISSSGASKNMVRAVQAMQQIGGRILSLTGFQADNPVRQASQNEGDFSVWLDSNHYGWVETAHQLILHALVDNISNQK